MAANKALALMKTIPHRLTLLLLIGLSAGCAHSPKTYAVAFGDKVFSVEVPRAPDEGIRGPVHVPSLPLNDDTLFVRGDYKLGLKLSWTFMQFPLFFADAGAVDLRAVMARSRDNDVTSFEGLKREIRAGFVRDVSGVTPDHASKVPIDETLINGTTWLKYRVPKHGSLEYALGLTPKRFLIVRFDINSNAAFNPEPLIEDITRTIRVQ